jgi:F0F1-type ATP synthase assembly protein I
MAQAVEWVARIATVAAEMVLPGLAGQWLDRRWGTGVFVLIGFLLGLSGGLYHLLLMTGSMNEHKKKQRDEDASNGD